MDDVDIKKATDNVTRLMKDTFRGAKELRVPPSALTHVQKKGEKAVPFGAAYMEAAPFDGDWFKGMWLSNGDFLRYFEAAILQPPAPAGQTVLVNAMSANTGMRWSLAETESALGVVAQDDSRAL